MRNHLHRRLRHSISCVCWTRLQYSTRWPACKTAYPLLTLFPVRVDGSSLVGYTGSSISSSRLRSQPRFSQAELRKASEGSPCHRDPFQVCHGRSCRFGSLEGGRGQAQSARLVTIPERNRRGLSGSGHIPTYPRPTTTTECYTQ